MPKVSDKQTYRQILYFHQQNGDFDTGSASGSERPPPGPHALPGKIPAEGRGPADLPAVVCARGLNPGALCWYDSSP